MSGFVRRYWLVAAVLGVFIALFVALIPAMVGRDATRDHSAFRKNAFGCAALAELCAVAQPPLRVRHITQPLDQLNEVEGLLLIIDPEYAFSDTEIDELARWVEEGGTLLVAFEGVWDDPSSFRSAAGVAYVPLAAALGVAITDQGQSLKVAEPAPSSPLGEGVERVAVDTRYTVSPLAGQEAAQSWAETESPRAKVECIFSHRPEDLTPHLVSDGHLIMASFGHGRGKVYVSADAQLFANALLSREDNLAFVANLLWTNATRRSICFDEYHHGFGPRTLGASEVDPTPLHRAAAVAVAGCVLFLIGKSIRFGAATPVFDPRRRSAAEYVEAMAGLWHGARAYPWALEQIASAFRRRTATAAGVAPGAPPEVLADALAERRAVPREETMGLLHDLEAARAAPRVTEGGLARLVKRMALLEQAAKSTTGRNPR